MRENKNKFILAFITSTALLFLMFCASAQKPAPEIEKAPEEKKAVAVPKPEEKAPQPAETLKAGVKKENGVLEYESLKKIVIPGNIRWTETKLHVQRGQEVYFKASGNISLQKGNPMANCGPEGLNLKSIQQPLVNRNTGALIGKILVEVTFTVDKETGEKTRHEIAEIFFLGSERRMLMPAAGSLWLGVNENVVRDNAGEYTVMVYFRRQE